MVIKTPSFSLAINTKGDENSNELAIVLPGRMDTKDYDCFHTHLELLASRGFFAIAMDPPGTWDSPGEIEFTTTNYITAVNELIAYFGNRPTLLFGHSRGGQVAMLVATTNPYVEGFVVVNASYGPPTEPEPKDIVNGMVVELRDLPPGTTKTLEQKKFLLSMNYFIDGANYDPIPGITAYKKPKLLFSSTEDETTPEEVREIYDKLLEPKMLYELKSDHNYRYFPAAVQEVNKIMDAFLATYLPI